MLWVVERREWREPSKGKRIRVIVLCKGNRSQRGTSTGDESLPENAEALIAGMWHADGFFNWMELGFRKRVVLRDFIV